MKQWIEKQIKDISEENDPLMLSWLIFVLSIIWFYLTVNLKGKP